MPPDMELSMRHTKLKAEEAALLAGEITKPSWESRNEGIHERVSFEDTIWGFDLAGGAYYKTPLRVTAVKPDSRAEKAGIRPGDKLLRINDIDTSTLTIQEAHDLILSSGIHLKISVTSPDDDEDAYYCYEDPIVDGYDSEEERRLEEEKAKKRVVHAKVSSYWSLQWPWVSKRRLIYRESNCFMVNSKYEEARRDKYPPLPVLRYTDDIQLFKRDGDKVENKKEIPSIKELKEKAKRAKQERLTNGDTDSNISVTDDEQLSHVSENEHSENQDSRIPPVVEDSEQEENTTEKPIIEEPVVNGDLTDIETTETPINEEPVVNGDLTDIVNGHEGDDENSEALSPIPEVVEETAEPKVIEDLNEITELSNDDDVINEVLAKNNDSAPRTEDENILDSILSDDGQNLESFEANNER